MANSPGRPVTTNEEGKRVDPRDKQVAFFLTAEDARYLAEVAETHQFRSRSEMITAIIERLIIGGFSPLVFAKVAFQLSRRRSDLGVPHQGFYFGLRPLPVLSDEVLTASEYKELLELMKGEKP